MKLSVKAFAITSALLWAGLLLMVGAANLAWPGYGMAFLDGMGSVYPGFHPGTGASSVKVIRSSRNLGFSGGNTVSCLFPRIPEGAPATVPCG